MSNIEGGNQIPSRSTNQQEAAESFLRDELYASERAKTEKEKMRRLGRAANMALMIGVYEPEAADSVRGIVVDVLSRNYDILEQEMPGFERPEYFERMMQEDYFYLRILCKINDVDAEELAAFDVSSGPLDDKPYTDYILF